MKLAPAAEAVWLTVPPFPVARRTLREWVASRRAMADGTFGRVLLELRWAGRIRRNRCGEYQLT